MVWTHPPDTCRAPTGTILNAAQVVWQRLISRTQISRAATRSKSSFRILKPAPSNCRDFTGNQEWPKMYAASVGLPFSRVFDDRASERAQFVRSSTLREASRLKNYGSIRVRQMKSQSAFARLSALNFLAALAIGHMGELWMTRTSC